MALQITDGTITNDGPTPRAQPVSRRRLGFCLDPAVKCPGYMASEARHLVIGCTSGELAARTCGCRRYVVPGLPGGVE
jgi:hypothetical protein